jgi:uncharacterized protein with GYD domain
MALYLAKFTHTPETWASMLAKPEDRRKALGALLEKEGGKLHGYWYAFGETDGYIVLELPDDVTAAATIIRVASTGAFASLTTTKLLTVDETLEALRHGSQVEYRAPGASG